MQCVGRSLTVGRSFVNRGSLVNLCEERTINSMPLGSAKTTCSSCGVGGSGRIGRGGYGGN
jgi:hypothetical protein